MVFAINDGGAKKCSFEEALDLSGFGKYNVNMLVTCCLLILAMYMDIFGFSVVLPVVACDLSLDTSQQGLLSSMPLIGIIVSSYGWGLCADTKGRRMTLLVAMPVGFVLSMAATMAPNYALLAILKLLSVSLSTGFTMWVPTMTNAYFTGDDNTGRTFCEVASQSTSGSSINTVSTDCTGIVKPMALYATMCYSGVSTLIMIFLSFIVGPIGKKRITLIVFTISSLSGLLLLFVKIPMLSIALFFIFLYVAQILGNVNTYLVELNPTHLRGMATCLSVVVARGFGFFSVQIIASLLGDYCTPMLSGYVTLVMSGFTVAIFLPSDTKLKGNTSQIE